MGEQASKRTSKWMSKRVRMCEEMDEVNDEEEEKDEEKKKQTGVSKYLEQTTLLICISRIASCMMGI